MTQALYTSMTGLNAGTEQLTVVSDNVANMNTTAYKTSRLDFQDIWYQTKTTGTNSTAISGGTNPYQVGVGVQCSSITKDFGASSVNTTGRTEDMALQGGGWFTVVNSDGAVLLTRDGTFALDEEGYLVTANGSKVLGMDSLTSETRSDIPIKLPTSIRVVEGPTDTTDFLNTKLGDLNNASITGGYMEVTVSGDNGTKKVRVYVGDNETITGTTVDTMVNTNMLKGKVWDGNAWVPADAANGTVNNQDITQYLTVEAVNGTLEFKGGNGYKNIDFTTDGDSNLASKANLVNIKPDENGIYKSKILDYSAQIKEPIDVTAKDTKNYKSFSVGVDGLVTVTYSDGSTLSVMANEGGNTSFAYTNPEGIIIQGDPNNKDTAALWVDPKMLVKANMQMQFAKVVNDGGLVAEGANMYSIGVNCGTVIYSASNVNGIGSLITGALESSNVDLAQQFSNMILAQRLVQANSQVFSGANQLLETLVYLGRG